MAVRPGCFRRKTCNCRSHSGTGQGKDRLQSGLSDMGVFRIHLALPIALLLLTGVGVALEFTWFESSGTWLKIRVGAMAMLA